MKLKNSVNYNNNMTKGIKAKTKVVDSNDPDAMYSKTHNQHNVPKRVKDFNKVSPKEAFGKPVGDKKNKKGKSKTV